MFSLTNGSRLSGRNILGAACLLGVVLFILVIARPASAQESGATTGSAANGLVTVESTYSFEETYDRLKGAIEKNDQLSIIAEVDHAANAKSVGMDLRPTRLIIFGNPKLGTQLMQSEQSAGIDLPQKFLVYQDAQGRTLVTYNDPYYVANRHGIEGQADVLKKISMALAKLTATATGSQQDAQQSGSDGGSSAEVTMPNTGGVPSAAILLGGAVLLISGGLLVRRLR